MHGRKRRGDISARGSHPQPALFNEYNPLKKRGVFLLISKNLHARIQSMAKKRKNGGKRGGDLGVRMLREHAGGVMRALGKGHTERVYHRAMVTSLNQKKVAHRSEVLAPIVFMGEVVGFGRCDLVIGNMVVELKANAQCPSKTSPQLCKYMASMGAAERKRFRGVVVNFNKRTGGVDILSKSKQKKRKNTLK